MGRPVSGEYSALVASGALILKTVALKLLSAELMEAKRHLEVCKMVAVLNTPVEVIEQAGQEASQLGAVTQLTTPLKSNC